MLTTRRPLLQVGIMKVGQDIPEVDAIVWMYPCSSPIDIVQMAGRALRPHGPRDPATGHTQKRAAAYLPILGSFKVDRDVATSEDAAAIAASYETERD